MALTNSEKQRILELKAQGKNLNEIMGYVGGQRLGRNSSVSVEELSEFRKNEQGLFKRIISDIPNDIKTGFSDATNSVSDALNRSGDTVDRVISGETTPGAGTLQTIGDGLKTGAEVVGQGILVAGKTFLPQSVETAIAETLGETVQAVAGTKPVKAVQERYESLTPEQQRNVQGVLGVTEGLGTMFGFGPVLNKLKGALSAPAKAAFEASDAALDRVRKVNVSTKSVTPPSVKNVAGFIQDFRSKISDIDPQVETALQRSNFDEVNKYFQQAKNAAKDPAKNTPFEFVGQRAEEAYDAIDEARKNAIQGKKSILEGMADTRVPGNTINDVMSSGIQSMSDRFGVTVGPKGSITQAPGRFAQLDPSDTKLVGEYFSRLNSLGVSPSVKQVDDFVDWAQGQLYKQSKSLATLDTAGEPIVRELQKITGDLNGRLKGVVGNGYGEVNARISRLIELQDEISRGLGADARKGGGFVKNLFSPTGGNTRKVFEDIRQETGIDLFKEATLAKFAMESVGDVRQRSLLQNLDVGLKEAATLNLTDISSIIRFIRERADLDGQELANAILRRSSSASPGVSN